MEATAFATPIDQSPGRRRVGVGAAVFIVFAGILHLLVAPQHLDHVGHGLFLMLAGVAEVAWGVAFWRKPSLTLYGLGIMLAGAFIMLWAITRVIPAPLGHGPGEVEVVDIISKAAEGVGLAGLVAMVLLGAYSHTIRWPAWKTILAPLTLAVIGAFILYGAGLTAERVFPWLGGESDHGADQRGLSAATYGIPSAPSASSPNETDTVLPTLDELFPVLSRRGNGLRGTSADVLYAPPIFFQVSGEEAPKASLERPTLVFLLAEADHEHEVGLAPEPPRTLLRLDGGDAIEPYQVTVLLGGDEHRESQILFPMPEGVSQETLSQEKHTLTFTILLESEGGSEFRWQLPLALPGEATSASLPAEIAKPQVSGLTQLLTRTLEEAQYQGQNGIRVDATFATQEYFAASLPQAAATRYLPGQFTVFLLTERLHTSDLPDSPPDITLSVDGQRYRPDMIEQVTASPHHRATLVRFPVEPPAGLRHRVVELLLPGDAVMTWHLPISYAGLSSGPDLGVTWIWLLAILGGLVAAMWPCLFQLTVFFIPALGGLSMQEARSGVPLGRRASVVKAAFFFVLGFTLVYTVAGALIGFAAGRLGDMSSFYAWQRYLGIAGGIAIVLLALRVAARVRAPLVCKMPLLSHMGRRQRAANPLEMMVAGLAFATGCMTCFGAAIVVAMVVYVGLSGSALIGAFTLFLFSMGMGIPLVLAAIAMSKVMPLLSRFEKAIRWMGLASSLIMVGFAVLLITGNYMVLTEWVYRMVPLAAVR